MANELIINASLPEIRITLMESGEIQELFIERESDKGIVGNIYKGRVTRVLPGMQAAFVDIGLEKAAFLYVDDIVVASSSFTETDTDEEDHEEHGALEAQDGDEDGIEHTDDSLETGAQEEVQQEESSEDSREDDSLEEDDETQMQLELKPESMGDDPNEVPEGTQVAETPAKASRPMRARRGRGTSRSPRHSGTSSNPRSRDRRLRPKTSLRSAKASVQIQDLIKPDQEILVQVAKDPISTKGARLTCHISLPGRHLVCMPTIDHVGVSRRIEREDERRRLREHVERIRPKNLGFIVRTASGKGQAEKRIKQDIDYLSKLWGEIQERAERSAAPALVYQDLNPVLRAVRDWVTEDIDKLIVDSKPYFQEITHFVSHFMPSMKSRVELYQGDIPIFDAYGISTQLSRGLERRVWLKSGGYIVIDQAEALVAIDVNTGKYVGKRNLEDTILKTNLEAVQEIAYQLRLRNCGGIIIIDLIDMEREESRQRVYRALEDALAKDRARPSILKISELGLIEMTRKRTRDTIVRALCEPCNHCEGKGYVKSRQTVAFEVMREIERALIDRDTSRILVQANQEVVDTLAIQERKTLDDLEKRSQKRIDLQAVQDFHPEQFEVILERKGAAERQRSNRSTQANDRSTQTAKPSGNEKWSSRNSNRNNKNLNRQRTQAAQALVEVSMPASSEAAQVAIPNSVDPLEEEDRLAFLRAQAAQDAALARLNQGSGQHGSSPASMPRVNRDGGNSNNAERYSARHKRGRTRRSFHKGRKSFSHSQGAASRAPSESSGGGNPPSQDET